MPRYAPYRDRSPHWRAAAALSAVLCAVLLTACSPQHHRASLSGIHKIRHVVIIMQENRSFDSYFGTFPGADGIPARNGRFTVCLPDPRAKRCDRPYHDPSLVNGGGAHDSADAFADIDGGKMDGFVRTAELSLSRGCGLSARPVRVCLASGPPDVMGYHDAREIPDFWAYATDFVLQDHLFESVASWSLPAHLYLVSGWSAIRSRTSYTWATRPLTPAVVTARTRTGSHECLVTERMMPTAKASSAMAALPDGPASRRRPVSSRPR